MLSNEDFLKRDFIRGDPTLEVALALAQKAHEGQKRKDGSPEIDHPMLVCNLLDWFAHKLGEDYGVEKAVAILHDAIEDNKEYRKNPLQFRADLAQVLKERFGSNALQENPKLAQWYEEVLDGVKELSFLDRSKYEDKRFVKVDKARRISPRWQKVKSLDQTASVVMDILNADMEGVPDIRSFDLLNAIKEGKVPAGKQMDRMMMLMEKLKKNMDIALKALDVAHVLNREAPDNPFHIFHKHCYDIFKEIYDLAYVKGDCEQAHTKQKQFNIEESLEAACAAHSEGLADQPKVHSYKRDITHRPRKGVLEIIVPQERTGRIVGFSMVVTPQEESEANRVCAELVKHIEQIPDVTVETHAILAPGISQQHVPHERLFTINGRLFFDTFMGLALKAGAMDKAYKNQILAEQQRLNSERRGGSASR